MKTSSLTWELEGLNLFRPESGLLVGRRSRIYIVTETSRLMGKCLHISVVTRVYLVVLAMIADLCFDDRAIVDMAGTRYFS